MKIEIVAVSNGFMIFVKEREPGQTDYKTTKSFVAADKKSLLDIIDTLTKGRWEYKK